MGVPWFYEWLKRTFPGVVADGLPENIESFLIDFNSIIYGEVAKVYGLTDALVLGKFLDPKANLAFFEETLLNAIVAKLDIIITKAAGKQIGTLVIAVDGVPPYAKVQQQRERCWITAAEIEEERRIIEKLIADLPSTKTEALHMIRSVLIEIRGKSESDMRIGNVFFTYVTTNATVAEMKRRLMRLAEYGSLSFNTNNIKPGTAFMKKLDERLRNAIEFHYTKWPAVRVIYSAHTVPGEGEHKIMEMLRSGRVRTTSYSHVFYSPDADVVLLMLVNKIANSAVWRTTTRSGGDLPARESVVMLDLLHSELTRRSPRLTLGSELTFILSVLGNDFLPPLMEVADFRNAASKLLDALTRHPVLTDEDSVVWSGFVAVLSELAETRFDGHDLLAERQRLYPVSTLNPHVSFMQGRATIDYVAFRRDWYWSALGLADVPGRQTVLDLLGMTEEELTERVAYEHCVAYLEGLQFVLAYYKGGRAGPSINPLWGYPFYYPPLLSDLIEMTEQLADDLPLDAWRAESMAPSPYVNQLYQLLSVLPPRDKALMPRQLHGAINNQLEDMFPDEFRYGRDYRVLSFEHVVWLPQPDPYRVMEYVDRVALPAFTPSELAEYAPTTDMEIAQKSDSRDFRRAKTGAGMGHKPRPPHYGQGYRPRGRGGYRGGRGDRGAGRGDRGSRGGYRGSRGDRGGYRGGRGDAGGRGRGEYRGGGRGGEGRGGYRGNREQGARGQGRGGYREQGARGRGNRGRE